MIITKATSKKRAKSLRMSAPIALGAPRADFGPSIRRQTIRDLGGVVLRDADVEIGQGPDPDHPDRQQDVTRGIRWLPLKLERAEQIEKDHLWVAEAYRNQLDLASGVMGLDTMMPSSGGTGTSCAIDVQIGASQLLERANLAMGRETTRVIRLAVSADTISEVAMGLGIDRKRVPVVIGRALADLKSWWDLNVKSVH